MTTPIGARATDNGIESLAFTVEGTHPVLTIGFKDPNVLGPGTYTDTVEVLICIDSGCNQTKAGSELSVPVTYNVAVASTVTLSANPTTTGAGMPVTLTWTSTDATACTASGEWSGPLPPSGSQVVTAATLGNHIYALSCASPGKPGQGTVTVSAKAPAVTLTLFPKTVVAGKPVTLRWASQYAASCAASGAWSGTLTAAGFRTLTPASLGDANFHLVCSNASASAPADASVTVMPAPAAPPATAYRMNESHDGVMITSNGIQHPSDSAPAWTRDLGALVSYPLIVNGRVYVTTANPGGGYGNRLYALDAHTGAILWGPIAVPGVYFGSGLTYENGRVFVLMFEGVLRAFDASNGAVAWTAQLPGYWFSGSPNAYGGIVVAAGNGGLSALDGVDGSILWTAATAASTDWTSPAVSSEGVFIQTGHSCGAGGYDPVTGGTSWRSSSPCDQPWGYSTVVRNGVVFGRVGQSLSLFDASAGGFTVQLGSQHAPAITSEAVIALNAGVLSSTRLSDRAQAWTFTGTVDDGGLVTSPVVVNETVFVGSQAGKVYGLDVATGAQVWTGVSPQALMSEVHNGNQGPPSGAAGGEDMLIFTSGSALVAWRLQ